MKLRAIHIGLSSKSCVHSSKPHEWPNETSLSCNFDERRARGERRARTGSCWMTPAPPKALRRVNSESSSSSCNHHTARIFIEIDHRVHVQEHLAEVRTRVGSNSSGNVVSPLSDSCCRYVLIATRVASATLPILATVLTVGVDSASPSACSARFATFAPGPLERSADSTMSKSVGTAADPCHTIHRVVSTPKFIGLYKTVQITMMCYENAQSSSSRTAKHAIPLPYIHADREAPHCLGANRDRWECWLSSRPFV